MFSIPYLVDGAVAKLFEAGFPQVHSQSCQLLRAGRPAAFVVVVVVVVVVVAAVVVVVTVVVVVVLVVMVVAVALVPRRRQWYLKNCKTVIAWSKHLIHHEKRRGVSSLYGFLTCLSRPC